MATVNDVKFGWGGPHMDDRIWGPFPIIVMVIVPKNDPEIQTTAPQSKDMEHLADELSYLLESSVVNQTTVDFLIPLPFNASHPVGETLRTATLVAQDIINEQQLLLPGC